MKIPRSRWVPRRELRLGGRRGGRGMLSTARGHNKPVPTPDMAPVRAGASRGAGPVNTLVILFPSG